jgi:hypothetical protein
MSFQIQPVRDMRNGYILKYDPNKGHGVIFSDEERFFFHRDAIVKGPIHPEVNSRVLFIPGQLRAMQKARWNAQWLLQPAYSIIVLEIDEGFRALAEPLAELAQDEQDGGAQ